MIIRQELWDNFSHGGKGVGYRAGDVGNHDSTAASRNTDMGIRRSRDSAIEVASNESCRRVTLYPS